MEWAHDIILSLDTCTNENFQSTFGVFKENKFGHVTFPNLDPPKQIFQKLYASTFFLDGDIDGT